MNIRVCLILLLSLISFENKAFEPYSGISCHNSKKNGNIEFFFKHDENFIYAKAYKRVKGEFVQIGDVVGQKISSFILFEDNTVDKDLNFAWHLDMVTKILKPFILSETKDKKFKVPDTFDCISKNFWF
jgi:hypothetical protein